MRGKAPMQAVAARSLPSRIELTVFTSTPSAMA